MRRELGEQGLTFLVVRDEMVPVSRHEGGGEHFRWRGSDRG